MITHVLYDDWEQLFIDGALLLEGHSISAVDLLRAQEAEVESIDMSVLPNDDFQVDNLASGRDLAAIRKAVGA